MLKSLHIENIAVIENTDIDFSGGLNCLTGETGAGKSIVIDAINAVLGERTSKELIRSGAQKALVSALFGDFSADSVLLLKESGYEPDFEGNLLVTRILTNSGGSVKINGKPATAGILRNISKALVNIHGQHDSQRLLDAENHIFYIDKIADNKAAKEQYLKEFNNFLAIRKELNSIETDEGENARKAELLKYQINEIESAKITVGESEKLKKQLLIVDDCEKIHSLLNQAYYFLNGNDDTDGAISLIRNAQKNLSQLGENFSDSSAKTTEVLSLLEDVALNIRQANENRELFEKSPEELRSRLDTLHRIMLKYGGSEAAALLFLDASKKELAKISSSKERIKELSDLIDISTEKLIDLGAKLSETRIRAAKSFSAGVTDRLIFMNMPQVIFETVITKGKYTKNGCDNIEFFIRTNAGDGLKPLVKIASGGELSRVMLAIKSVLAENDDVDTLIFDEIDTGISGRTADKVGTQLKSVSKTRQVICVTHLAQIAAYSDNHLLIEKTVKENKTFTLVKSLNREERIKELSRIMSGGEITENLYNSAKELLDRSR